MDLLPANYQVKAELCRRSLYSFIKEFWEDVEPGTVFKDNWHIGAIAEHLEAVQSREIKRLIINISPRSCKSLECSVFFPAWVWSNQPSHRFLYASYAQALSTRDSLKCRRLIQTDKYLKFFGDKFKLTPDQNAKIRFENDQKGHRIASSVGGQLTGDGGDTLFIDDPHNVVDAESKAIRESTIDWFDGAFRTRLNDPETGAIVIIMQRVHAKDLSGHLYDKEPEVWDRLVIPARYESKHPYISYTSLGFEDPRKEDGELMWPNRLSDEKLKELEAGLGPYNFAGQFQQRPSPAEGGIIKKEWFQFYNSLPENGTHLQSWDCAFKKSDTSDYIAGLQLYTHEGLLYVVDMMHDRMSFTETVDAIKSLVDRYPKTGAKYVEDKANGPAIIDHLRSKISGLIGINPGKDSKESRVEAAAPHIRSGNVLLPANSPISQKIIEECCTFPNGANDDIVDALVQAIIQVFGKPDIASLYAAI